MSQGSKRYWRSLRLAGRFATQIWWLGKTNRLLPAKAADQRRRKLYLAQAQEFRRFAVSMGGLIIKVGQFLSTRVDMLPKEYIDELGKLQDAVPPESFEQITAVIEAELGGTLAEHYASIDAEPVAAASLGQVHRATLLDGQEVAVKVQRPGIDELVEVDLRALRSVMGLLARFTPVFRFVDWEGVCDDFETTHRDELDYLKEGRNAETFQRNFLFNPHVEMPQIHWGQTTRKVLTMEFMGGVKINDLAALDQAGVDRSELARNLMELYLHMLLTDGFFHADPHPGNILVRPDGIIQLIDFGMVGAVSEQMRQQFINLVTAFFGRDPNGVVLALQEMGFVGWDADVTALKQSLIPLIDTMIDNLVGMFRGSSFLDTAVAAGPRAGIAASGASLDQLREVILTQPVSLPGYVSFIGKALITVFSNCYKLDPEVDLVAIADEWVRPLKAQGAQQILNQLLDNGWTLLKSLPSTLRHLVSLAEKLDQGTLTVALAPAQLRQLEAADRANTRRWRRTALLAAGGMAGALLAWRRTNRPTAG
ncbi:MAG: AarF/ABC1/UbiB kinase family protein [Bifidobacteriaceae bacterium]|jgi:predicted unusual protein kinase regulating ubiquinone biosynthesis (AarF/ABC1/UbiB family)|nr:AarF/ABC1/UbiB kinase family protein [Bifidobacteriaceae bacterium]